MNDTAELLQDLMDIVVLEWRNDAWRSRYPLPVWFSGALLARPRSGAANSFANEEATSPFFQHVLEQTLQSVLADGEPSAAPQEIWTEDTKDGKALVLSADARIWRGRTVLLVRRIDRDFNGMGSRLQTAREQLLTNEKLEAEVFRRTRDIRHREEEIALRLLAASKAHDTETGSHVRRIGLYSAALAEALGWPAEKVADIRVAAPMHDIGKIGIQDSILKKPGRLSDEEWVIMRTHAEIGAGILANEDVPLLQLAAEIAAGHHERYDGTGYPRGLKGQAIPVGARIVAIVDVYDALVHRRVYKPPMEEEKVVAEMRAESGRHFDPMLLDLFFENLTTMRRIRLENPDEPLPEPILASSG